jgi:hypothetical protein
MMYWEGFRRKQVWPNRGSMISLLWRERIRNTGTSRQYVSKLAITHNRLLALRHRGRSMLGEPKNIFDGSHPDMSRNYYNRVISVKHNLIYSLITIRLAKCFYLIGSLSGLHYEPINVRKLLHSWDPNKVYKNKCKIFVSIGHEHFTFIFVNIFGIPKIYAAF